ncbi:hypothetical protein Tco_1186458 [Tanacetum coccineum]
MAVIEDCWFQAMQDEIHEFDRLEVWELVPRPIYVMVIALKWIYKVKLDEYGDVLKNKARLVAKISAGGRIDFEESFDPKEVFVSQLKGFEDQENLLTSIVEEGSLWANEATRACLNLSITNGGSIETGRGLWGFQMTQLDFEEWWVSLCSLTASRPDLCIRVYMCARYQAKPTKSTLKLSAVSCGSWVGCLDSRKKYVGSAQFLGDRFDQDTVVPFTEGFFASLYKDDKPGCINTKDM